MRRAGSAFVGVDASLACVSSGIAAKPSFCEMLAMVVAWGSCVEQVRKYALSSDVVTREFHIYRNVIKMRQFPCGQSTAMCLESSY